MSREDGQQQSNSSVPADNNLPAPANGGQPVLPVVQGDPSVNTPQGIQSPGPQDTPPIADDTDLIEKEWVDKAKQILERNKDNPHALNQEINKVKADYVKKRYNKDLKTSDD